MALDEAKLRKVALITVPVVGAFACVALTAIALWFFQGREFWATSSRTVAGIGTDAHTALLPVAGVVTRLQGVADSAGKATDALTGLEKAATPVVAHLGVTEGKLDAAVDLTSHSLNDRCPTPKQIEAGDTRECGTLANTNKLLDSSNLAVGRVAVAADSFDKHQSKFYDQESAIAGSTQKLVTDFDTAVTTSDVPGMVAYLRKIASDIYDEVHGFVHPSKKKLGFWGVTEAAGDYLKHFMPSLF